MESLQVEGFDYPKPVSLVKKLIDACATKSNNDLILDFFSGSGTTAQAVIELNNNDGGNRKFILVQIPENGICDLARDRIDKAGFGLSGDVGFKVFECVDA